MLNIINFVDRERSDRRNLFVLGLVLLAAYGWSVFSSLFGDDLMLLSNAREADWSFTDLSRSFVPQESNWPEGWWPAPFTAFRLQFFRPICMASFKLDQAIWGEWIPGYHLTNIALQYLVIVLVYFWGKDFGLDRRSRFLMAVLHTVYIPNIMTVNWISGRTELINAVCVLTSVLFLGRFYLSRRRVDYLISFAALIVALGTKESAVILPFMHILAAFFLYRPKGDLRAALRIRAAAIAPFFLMLPPYFALRYWALEGFPVPPTGFYYHSITDPDFPRFVVAKVTHAILFLVFQVPVIPPPELLARSVPFLIVFGILASLTVVAVLRFLKGPQRYFLLGWVALTLAPTVPIGLNFVYYYLCAPVVAVFYVQLYRHYSISEKSWQQKWARGLIRTGVGAGVAFCALSAILFHNLEVVSRSLSAQIIAEVKARPEVSTVYLMDMNRFAVYTMPEIRYTDERSKRIKFMELQPGTGLIFPSSSTISQVSADSFEVIPDELTYFTTGIEPLIVGTNLIEFTPGMRMEFDGFDAEIVEVAPHTQMRSEFTPLRWFRSHFGVPCDEQMGVSKMRFRFDTPLDAPEKLFLHADGFNIHVVEFNEAEASE